MSASPHSPEKGTLMEDMSHIGGGHAVSSTDSMLKAQSSPVLRESESPSTLQSAVQEPSFPDNQVEGNQEEGDGESAREKTEEETSQQDIDNKQEEDRTMEHKQEEAIEDDKKPENTEEGKPLNSLEEGEPESEEMRQEGLDIRQEVDKQAGHEESGQELRESKSTKPGDENSAEKMQCIGQKKEEEVKQQETRHQNQGEEDDLEGENSGQRNGKYKVDDKKTKENNMDGQEEQEPIQELKHEDLDINQVTDSTLEEEIVEEHKKMKEGNKEEMKDQNLDAPLEADMVEKSSQEHKEMERKCKEDTMEQELSEEHETVQEKQKQLETDQERLEEEEELSTGDVGIETKHWTIIKTIEEDFPEMPMDIDCKEEKMQVIEDAGPSMGKSESYFEETMPELKPAGSQGQSSEVSLQDLSSNRSENHTVQELKDEMMESSIQPPVQPVEDERMDLDTSNVLSVKVKDEPMDEEYEKALVPQEPTEKVKDEPETSEENDQKAEDDGFKISAVFSVGRNSARSSTGSPAVTPSAKASSNSSTPASTSASSLCVVCSGCKKVLLKGQTAFQRKGSPQLYCSPQCLCSTATELVVKPAPKKSCHCCLKEIPNPKDVIIAPVDSAGLMKDFCSQKCLSTINIKRDSANSTLPADQNSTKCSICQKSRTSRHEVNFLGNVHKLCSDACFDRFRSSNKLTMNCCMHCGGYCYSGDGQCSSLLVDGALKKFCSQNCLTAYKKKYGKPVSCTMCRGYHSIVDMVESINSEGSRELFCSSACVTAHKVQTVSSSGAAVECNNCKLVQVPQYHLAMSDGTIRNFCSFTCVVTFQESFNKTNSQNQLNVVPPSLTTTLPQSAPKPASTKPVPAEPSSSGNFQIPAVTKIPCAQCQRSFFRRPELLDFKGKMYAFCDKACIDEFRRTNYIMAQCVYCKIDKVVKEIKRINNIDCSFCSEGCKLLYKHDLAKRWGKKHCRNCLYCTGTSHSVVTSLFSGRQEEFCGNECLSQYTLLFCQVAKCSTCKRAKKMVESVKWLGEMKHFCSLQCLMFFCSLQRNPAASVKTTIKTVVTQPTAAQPAVSQGVPISVAPVIQHALPSTVTTQTSLVTKEATPVIANVISLSSTTNGQPNVLGSTSLQGTVPSCVKLIGHASTQTDTMKQHPTPPPRILKNKALLCKPMSLNKGTSCKPNTSDVNIQTDETIPRVVVVPLPVPVYVPVPMHLYTQYTPHGVGLPLPVPVPMFLPTTLDSAERIVETIQKIKEKIPENPIEADLIMMAEMVAEDNEKEKTVSHGDQEDNFIEDFDLEALSSHLSWEEDNVSNTPRWSRTSEPEKAPAPAPVLEPSPQSKSTPRSPSPVPTPQEQQMDLEADFPVECFELLEQRTQKDKTPSTRQRPRRRGRDGFPQKKRPRKRSGGTPPSPSGLPNISKLHHEYGIQAWKSWIRWRNAQPNMETPKIGARNMMLKEDLLQCSTAELSYGLCKFISEVRRPNGEPYSPDSIHYLCLGIQQHLFENGRMENIFADIFYAKFSQSITNILKDWKPIILPSGYVHSRVEEEYLWECKQLGAFSPSVLLNTLLYFCTKFFNFKTLAQHHRLSFAHVMRCTRFNNSSSKMACLRFYPPVPREGSANADGVPAKRKREDDEADESAVMEMQENAENPLRCPVRLYEFYLSKCSSSVKQRTNIFYLRPERSCVPNSPLWFSSMSLEEEDLDNMLTRILTVRELYTEREKPTSISDSDIITDSD